MVDAVVVDGGLEEVGIGFEPVVVAIEFRVSGCVMRERYGMAYHFGMLRDGGSIL